MLFCFFSSRRRHTRCALVTGVQTCALPISYTDSPSGWGPLRSARTQAGRAEAESQGGDIPALLRLWRTSSGVPQSPDRKSVVWGKRVSGRLDLAARRYIKTKIMQRDDECYILPTHVHTCHRTTTTHN